MTYSDVESRPLLGDDNTPYAPQEHRQGLWRLVSNHRIQTVTAYICFLILGASTLLAWNTLILCFPYVHLRLEQSNFASSYSSWVTLFYTFFTFVFMVNACLSQSVARQSPRISSSILLMTCTTLVLTIVTRFTSIPPNIYFVILLFITIFLAAATAYLQNALASLSSSFGPVYLQAFMAGQGIVGFVVSLVQITSAAAASDPDKNVLSTLANGTFIFLLIATVFCLVAFFSLITLINLPLFKATMETNIANADDGAATYMSRFLEIRRVEPFIRRLCLSGMSIYLITITAFPVITTTIASTSSPKSTWTTILFIPFSYVVFGFGDWFGRSLPGFPRLRWAVGGGKSSVRKLSIAAFSRIAFILLFLACNVTPRQSDPLIKSDLAYIAIMFLFATSNGYLCTLIMIAAINKNVIPEKDIPVAATCSMLYLTFGLIIGSLMSFVVRALMCGCNPFVTL